MILNHPRIPNVTVDVVDVDVKRWTAQGWVDPTPEPEPEPEPAEDATEPAPVEVEDAPKPKRRRK